MQFLTSDSENSEIIRQWIEELTNYTPQKVEEVLEQMRKAHRLA